MRRIVLLFIFFSTSVFSQEIEYEKAKDYLEDNEIEKANKTIQIAIKKLKKNKSKYFLLYASVLKNKNIADSSLYYYNIVEQDYSKRKITDSLLLTLATKVEFYRFFNNKKKAISQVEKIDKIAINDIKNKDIVGYTLNRKLAVFNGFYYGNKDTLNLIQSLGNEILNLESEISNKEIVAYTLNELAQIEDYRGDKNEAIKKYENALSYARKNSLLNPEIDISYNYATIYARYKNNNLKAAQILEEVKDKVVNGTNLSQKYSFFLQLKFYYKAINDYKKAFEASEDSYHYSQESNGLQAEFRLSEMEKKFDFAKKEKEIQEKENEIAIQNLEIKSNSKKLWLILIIFLLTLLGILALIYFFRKTRKKNQQLKILAEENSFLMAEANHRINNNLQLIIILINEELKKTSNENNVQIKKVLTKVDAIATLHRHLYNGFEKRNIDLDNYLKDIQINFYDTFNEKDIKIKFDVEKTSIPVDVAMYIGLLLTELNINSLKHAFIKQEYKEISIAITNKNNQLYFNYSDNGVGVNKEIKLKLIDKLCRQLKVEYSLESNKGFNFTFLKNI